MNDPDPGQARPRRPGRLRRRSLDLPPDRRRAEHPPDPLGRPRRRRPTRTRRRPDLRHRRPASGVPGPDRITVFSIGDAPIHGAWESQLQPLAGSRSSTRSRSGLSPLSDSFSSDRRHPHRRQSRRRTPSRSVPHVDLDNRDCGPAPPGDAPRRGSSEVHVGRRSGRRLLPGDHRALARQSGRRLDPEHGAHPPRRSTTPSAPSSTTPSTPATPSGSPTLTATATTRSSPATAARTTASPSTTSTARTGTGPSSTPRSPPRTSAAATSTATASPTSSPSAARPTTSSGTDRSRRPRSERDRNSTHKMRNAPHRSDPVRGVSGCRTRR